MQNGVCGKEMKRMVLFHELYDKKNPEFGNFNSNYNQTRSIDNSMINENFENNYQNETNTKFLNRYYYSKILRNSNQ